MHPRDFIGYPALVTGRKRGGMIEGAGIDFGELWERGIGEKQRAAAVGAE